MTGATLYAKKDIDKDYIYLLDFNNNKVLKINELC